MFGVVILHESPLVLGGPLPKPVFDRWLQIFLQDAYVDLAVHGIVAATHTPPHHLAATAKFDMPVDSAVAKCCALAAEDGPTAVGGNARYL